MPYLRSYFPLPFCLLDAVSSGRHRYKGDVDRRLDHPQGAISSIGILSPQDSSKYSGKQNRKIIFPY